MWICGGIEQTLMNACKEIQALAGGTVEYLVDGGLYLGTL